MKRPRARFIVLLALAVILYAVTAQAGGVTFCNVCTGYTISKRGDDVLIRCPGVRDPWMTFKNCKTPKATRVGANLTLTCGG